MARLLSPGKGAASMPTARPSLTAFEDMKGYLTVGDWPSVNDEDYQRAFVEGRRNDTWVLTNLDLSADDLAAMLADPKHPLRIRGYIQADSSFPPTTPRSSGCSTASRSTPAPRGGSRSSGSRSCRTTS